MRELCENCVVLKLQKPHLDYSKRKKRKEGCQK